MFTNNNGKSMSQKGNISIISSDTNINGNGRGTPCVTAEHRFEYVIQLVRNSLCEYR